MPMVIEASSLTAQALRDLAWPMALWAGVHLLLGFRGLSRARRIHDLAKSRVATAPQGLVEFEGFSWRDHYVTQTLHRKTVVHYELILEKLKKRGKNWRWEQIWGRSGPKTMLLCDETGACVLKSDEAHVTCDGRKVTFFGLSQSERQDLVEQVNNHLFIDALPTNWFLVLLMGSQYRVRERWIEIGQPVYALGRFSSFTNGPMVMQDPDLLAFAAKLQGFHREGRFRAALDKDRNGHVSAEEYRKGFATAAGLAYRGTGSGPLSASSHTSQAFPAYSLHGQLSKSEELCEISTLSQSRLRTSLNGRSWLHLAMSGFIVAALIWALTLDA